MNAKILSFGAMYLDIISTEFPTGKGLKLKTETVGKSYTIAPGGSALNFARMCKGLRMEPIFIGKRGNDPMGEILEKMVKDEGITPAFIRSADVTTNLGINYVDNKHISLLTVVGSANQSLSSRDIEEQVKHEFLSATHLYLGGCFKLKALLNDFKDILMLAKKHNLKIILDHGRINNNVTPDEKTLMREIITMVDYYFPSKDEFLTLWEIKSIVKGLKLVKEKTDAVIVVKDAENGVYSVDKNIIHVPAFPVDITNTVGAGDSFNAGFIKAQTHGLSLEKSMRFGCATAALKISQKMLPTYNQIISLLKHYD